MQVTDYVDRKNMARFNAIFSGNLQQILEGYDDIADEEVRSMTFRHG